MYAAFDVIVENLMYLDRMEFYLRHYYEFGVINGV